MEKEKNIYVFADFLSFHNEFLGTVHVSQTKGREFYSFEYDEQWLAKDAMLLDPDLQWYRGRQYISDNKQVFGFLSDSAPDRWGRRLMNRREELRAKKEGEKPVKLMESDYLLGVFDESRMGGLRFKADPDGEYVSNDADFATPPWTSLRELEQAATEFEKNETSDNDFWLKQLLAPGSSLGGARPKASVIAPDGSMWIAKFPSKHDEFDSGAWEMVVHELALLCGINVPEARAEVFSSLGTTFLVKRFDRAGKERIHFSSAMTMLGKSDGADATDGSSYLEIVSFLKANGANPKQDLIQLWKRIVFGMAVSNTDDHFRNHGVLLTNNGWILSPMYDVNPDVFGEFLSLNVDSDNSAIDLNLAIEASKYYGITKADAASLADEIVRKVDNNWRALAGKYGISHSEAERMSPAFSRLNHTR
ncbi:MAG: type II toxin-antitoxin system HipA family toxin [Lachnospiraceae bacterium]|nr:type II toxin-antitoxin system HipA family toxin [Lachnospiraceae bacterium]